jgi:hypothetical protein
MEFLFEIVAEFVLQILFEALMELALHSVKNTLQRQRNPVFSTIGFLLWGALAGGISLWIFPRSFIADHQIRLLNLILTPLGIGGFMLLVGKQREKRGQSLVGLDRFSYAFAFAFAMALVRLSFVK